MILQAKNITKAYGELEILKGVDLSIKENEINYSTINNHTYLLGGSLINKIDILFKKI